MEDEQEPPILTIFSSLCLTRDVENEGDYMFYDNI